MDSILRSPFSGEDTAMAKAFNQKLKILYLMQMLLQKTDENHAINMQQILSALEENGIAAERKSVYDDMEVLKQFGLDIRFRKSQPAGYYMGSRSFELPELKLLVDAVQSSRFITAKKAEELVKKLESMTSEHGAKQLQQQVHVNNRIKTMSESVYYNVDKIHSALSDNHPISFQYYEWNVKKEMQFRKDGARYLVSPWFLNWVEENYYLVAYDHNSDKMKHYRVDKMAGIQIVQESRQGEEKAAGLDADKYVKKTFGMSGGKVQTVELGFKDKYAGVVMDRFGRDVDIKSQKDGTFKVRVEVAVSESFFGWVSGLGTGVKILKPKSVAEDYRDFLKKLLKQYK